MAETNFVAGWDSFGIISVSVFIVLSGYCLALPYAVGNKPFVIGTYLRRRAIRLLPPYYAALALSLCVIYFRPSHTPNSFFWNQEILAFNKYNILTHVLVIHNVYRDWAYGVNFPLWSVATEWQIYFFLPFLVGIYRRTGPLTTINASLIVSIATMYTLLHFTFGLNTAHPELLALFAFGVVTAFAQPNRLNTIVFLRRSRQLFIGSLLLLGLLLAHPSMSIGHLTLLEMIAGCVTATGLISLQAVVPVVNAVLESPPLTILGRFSYSLYLIHAPVLALVHCFTPYVLLFGLPLSIAAAYPFYLIIERPCINALHQARGATVAPADAHSP